MHYEDSGLLRVASTESPVHNMKRINTQTKTVHRQLFEKYSHLETDDCEGNINVHVNWINSRLSNFILHKNHYDVKFT